MYMQSYRDVHIKETLDLLDKGTSYNMSSL